MSHRTQAATGATLVLLASLLAGCSGDDDASKGGAVPKSEVATAASTRAAAAVKDLKDINCRRGADGWDFRATVTNHGKAAMTYSVKVSLATKKDGTVLGSKQLSETVAPGKSAQLRAEKFYAGTEKDVVCVPSATKAAPQG